MSPLVALLFLAGCTDDGAPDPLVLEGPSGCDPTDPALCVLPFPSNFFTVPDSETVTGRRVAFGASSLPVNRDGVQMQPEYWNEKDGFSINSHPLAYFADLSSTGLVSWTAPEEYLDEQVTTVIVDTTTGQRVPHFAEKDLQVRDEVHSLLILRPLVPLSFNRRYVVGIRGLTTQSGAAVEVSESFSALRDDTATTLSDVEDRRLHFEDSVFPVLEGVGFARSELQLAWDFTTMSRESTLGRMEWMLGDVLTRVGTGPSYTIESWEDDDCTDGGRIGRTIYGQVEVPQYTETGEPGTLLTRDENGMPYANGTKQADFMVRVPCSVILSGEAAPILQYGHGLLGSSGEARTGWLSDMANRHGWIIFAMNWTGMSENDRGEILLMSAGDPTRFPIIPERSQQGFIDKVVGLRMMLTSFVDEPLMQYPDADADGIGDAGSVSIIDPTRRYYTGQSQGAILGGAYLAISPDLERGVLGVGGQPYAMLLNRSNDFDLYFQLFRQKYTDDRDISLLVNGLMQMLWDPGESGGYGQVMTEEPFPGNPQKSVLMQVAMGDVQVTHLGGRIQARSFGAKTVQPLPEGSLFGLEDGTAPFTGSAYVEWEYEDVPTIPLENVPPEGLDPHECPRREPEAQDQLRDFLVDGVVNNYCMDESGAAIPCRSSVAERCP